MKIRVLNLHNEKEMMEIIKDAFTSAPWNDNWEDENVFRLYIRDIVGNANSLALGLYDENNLVGLSLGRLKHWFDGIEYCIDDLCISPSHQGMGAGSAFIRLIKKYSQENNYKEISLRTNRTALAYQFYKTNGFLEKKENVFFSMKCNECQSEVPFGSF